MKKRMQFFALVILFSLILSTVAFAAMNSSDYIDTTSAHITRNGNTVTVNFYVVGVGIMNEIGVKNIYLYELNGSSWSLVKTFNYLDPLYAATMMQSNTHTKNGSVSYSGSAGKQYFASCWFYAEKDGGSDTITHNAY